MATKTKPAKKTMTKEQLAGEIGRLVDLAHKALGAREPDHSVSVVGLGRKYIEEMVYRGKGDG